MLVPARFQEKRTYEQTSAILSNMTLARGGIGQAARDSIEASLHQFGHLAGFLAVEDDQQRVPHPVMTSQPLTLLFRVLVSYSRLRGQLRAACHEFDFREPFRAAVQPKLRTCHWSQEAVFS